MTRHIELSVPPAESNPLKQKPTQRRKVLQLWASPLSGRQPSDKKFYLQSLLIRVSAWCDARLESAFKNTSRKSAACSLISICVTHTSLFKDGLSFGRVPTSTELLRMIDSDWEEVKWLQQPPLSSQQVQTLQQLQWLKHQIFTDSHTIFKMSDVKCLCSRLSSGNRSIVFINENEKCCTDDHSQ